MSSTWQKDMEMPTFAPLAADIKTGVCIVGGGLTGLLCAYLLAKAGKKVAVLEKRKIGQGATGLTTGFLTQAIDTNTADLIHMFGAQRVGEILGSHRSAIELIEKIVREEKIECEFVRCSNYLYAAEPSELSYLEKEHKAAESVGAPVRFTNEKIPGFTNHGYLEFKDQAKFHVLKFLAGLVTALSRLGVDIYEETEVTEIEEKEPLVIRAKGHSITAEHAIVATYRPLNEPSGLFFKKAMYVSYVVELSIPRDAIAEGMYEDQQNPYHYFRVDRGRKEDRLIVGGEDHRADISIDPSKNFHALSDFVRDTFSDHSYKIVRRWRGPILEPIDGLPYIGPYGNPRTLYAFGFSGSGMTYAPIAAMILSDTITGKKNAWADLYRVNRLPNLASLYYKGRDFTAELFNGAIKNALAYRKES